MIVEAHELKRMPGHRVLCDGVDVTGMFTAANPDEGWIEFDMPSETPRRVRFYGKVVVVQVQMVFVCKVCKRPFTSAGGLLTHLAEHHLSVN